MERVMEQSVEENEEVKGTSRRKLSAAWENMTQSLRLKPERLR